MIAIQPNETLRALAGLEQDDRARLLVELALETDEPAVTAAVVRRLIAEIRTERDRTRRGAVPQDLNHGAKSSR